ncbi:MAG: LamG domain-containing protein [Nanoarchaeota archaeon]
MIKRICSITFLLVIFVFPFFVLADQNESINFSSLDLINRKMHSDIYYDSTSGYRIAKVMPEAINYRNNSNSSQYIPIDINITDINLTGFKYGVETGIYKSYFKEKSGASDPWMAPLKIIKEGYALILDAENLFFTGERAVNKKLANATYQNNSLTYDNQFENIDLEYTYKNSQLKEDLIIEDIKDLDDIKENRSSSDELVLEFTGRAYNISSNQSMNMEINNEIFSSINLTEIETNDSIYFLDETNETIIFSFIRPMAYDSNNSEIYLRYTISTDSYGNLDLNIYTPNSWLENATYPVYIDPTIDMEVGGWGRVGYDCDHDSFDYDDENLIGIGARTANYDYINRGFVEFYVEDMADDITITDVDLYYYLTGQDDQNCGNFVTLKFYELDEHQYDTTDPDNVETEALWNAIGDDDNYGENNHFGSHVNQWHYQDLGSASNVQLQDLIDGYPTGWFDVGMKITNSDEVCTEDCHVDIEYHDYSVNLPYIAITYAVPCNSNSDCSSNEYCGADQLCHADLADRVICNGITNAGTNSEEDGACISGYCDNDDVGWSDDGWCFTPYNTYFDGEETSFCEYSTGYGLSVADERTVGTNLNTCDQSGQVYFEDEVSSTCVTTDITSIFECTDSGCSCGDLECDGLAPQTTLNYCNRGGESYFQDDCGSNATIEDYDNICRSPDSLGSGDGCTADSLCDGVEAGTNGCNAACVVSGNWTQNVSMYVNDVEVWNQSGYFSDTETTDDFSGQLNDALASCTPDEMGYCDIPIILHSDNAGSINVSNINVYFNITEYIWDVSDLEELSTYKVRIMSSDGSLNSSWDESDADFTIVGSSCGDLCADNLSVIYENSSEMIFSFNINNLNNVTLQDINWTFNTGEETINSDYNNISLESNEDMFVYFDYNYSAEGNYTVTATANSDGLSDSTSIAITILFLSLLIIPITSLKSKSGKVKLTIILLIIFAMAITIPIISSQNQTNETFDLVDFTSRATKNINSITVENISINESWEVDIPQEINFTNETEIIEEVINETNQTEIFQEPNFREGGGSDIGYELLDNNQVLHIWNTEDDYYFNATSGMQFTNHYQEYWSRNVFCGGYYLNGDWNVLTCINELPFNWSIDSDDETYVNVTGYRDVSFAGYSVRIALRYHLKTYDTRLSIIPYIKNLGSSIPYDLGFAWKLKDIQIDMEEEGNTLRIYSDQGYPVKSLYNLDETYYSTNGSMWITNNDTLEHIYMEWDQNLVHAVQAKPEAGQYNSPITLAIKVGTLDADQEKSTRVGWVDANPYCENVGTSGYQDGMCFFSSSAITSPSYSNFSDGTNPKFKITIAQSQPEGCTYQCKLFRQYGSEGSWSQIYSSSGAGCYNYDLGIENITIGHSRTENNLTIYDLCIIYSGESCSDLGYYCGAQPTISSKGDVRWNMSNNKHTPLNVNVTLTNTGEIVDASFDVIDSDISSEGDSIIVNLTEWYFDGTHNSSYDNLTSINITGICSGNITYRVQSWDDSYFSPTDNQTWVWSNTSFASSCPPTIIWEDPTPVDEAIINSASIYLNTTITDETDTSAFFDWNYDLVGYWGMDSYATSRIGDSSSYNNYGVLNNGLSSSDITTGKYGDGLQFDGNDDYANAGNDSSLEMGTNDMTIQAWIKLGDEQPQSNTGLVCKGAWSANAVGYSFLYLEDYDRLRFYVEGEGDNRVGQASNNYLGLNDSQWHQVAVVFDRDGETEFFVDGISVGSGTTIQTGIGSEDIANPDDMDLLLGSWMTNNWYFNGTLDEAKIFKRALSPEEINASYNNGLYKLYHNFTSLTDATYDYTAYVIDTSGDLTTNSRSVTVQTDTTFPEITWENPTPNDGDTIYTDNIHLNTTITDEGNTSALFDWNYSLVGYWTMDYYNSTGIYDNSTYSNFGSFNGGLSTSDLISGKYGNGLKFDGNDYIEIPNDESLSINDKFTIEAWVKVGNITTDNGIVSKVGSTYNYNLRIANSNPNIELYDGTHYDSASYSQDIEDDGLWHHIVAIIDLDNDYMTIYLDGDQGQTKDISNFSSVTNEEVVNLGRKGASSYFNGSIDEVKIHHRVLGSEEINASYNNGLYRLYHDFVNLIINETYDYSAYAIDSAGNLNVTAIRNVTIAANSVTNETEARQAILEGINNSIPTATIYIDQQIYTVTLSNQQTMGSFDKVAILGNQTWAFNYLTSGESYTNVNGLGTTVNIWENETLSYSQIVTQVESLIDGTKF